MRNLALFLLLFSAIPLFAAEELSRGYKEITLGMGRDEVEALLKKDLDFMILKEEVLQLRLEPDQEIITIDGAAGLTAEKNGVASYIIIGYFHFSNNALYQIFIQFHKNKIGYYNLLKQLTEKFGKPKKLDPKRATWEDEEVRIVIEKPCSIKYIYLPVWNELLKSDLSDRKTEKILREKFIDNL